MSLTAHGADTQPPQFDIRCSNDNVILEAINIKCQSLSRRIEISKSAKEASTPRCGAVEVEVITISLFLLH